jgi:hypothetical protein
MALLLDPEFLDRAWQRYLHERYANIDIGMQQRQFLASKSKHYRHISRRDGTAVKFEEMLFEHGGTVRQINGQRYLEFAFEEQATLYALKCNP